MPSFILRENKLYFLHQFPKYKANITNVIKKLQSYPTLPLHHDINFNLICCAIIKNDLSFISLTLIRKKLAKHKLDSNARLNKLFWKSIDTTVKQLISSMILFFNFL